MRSFLYKKLQLFGPTILLFVLLVTPSFFAFADTIGQPSAGTTGQPSANTIGQPKATTLGNGNCNPGNGDLCNPLAVSSICQLIGLLLKAAIAVGIPIAVLFIVYAGLKFVLARGSPGELGEARNNLVATLIGIAIFLGASLIANVIIATLHQLGVNGVNSC